jgi:hypothetical protein
MGQMTSQIRELSGRIDQLAIRTEQPDGKSGK